MTYTGRYENGSFIVPEIEKIPNNSRVIITIVADNITEHEAAENFLNAMEELRHNGFSEEDNAAIDALQRGEYKLEFKERLL